jgi:hypothetical protein
MQQTIERAALKSHFVPNAGGGAARQVAAVETPDASDTVHGDPARRERKAKGRSLLLRVASTIFWAVLGEKTFVRTISQRRVPEALVSGALAAGTAYVQESRRSNLVSEYRVSKRSLFSLYTVIGLGLGLGATFRNRR